MLAAKLTGPKCNQILTLRGLSSINPKHGHDPFSMTLRILPKKGPIFKLGCPRVFLKRVFYLLRVGDLLMMFLIVF